MLQGNIFSLLLIGIFSLILFFIVPYGLSPDEAHYWLWSYHLDWSYYSKGPLVAEVISWSRYLFGDTPRAVRLPALLFSLGSFLIFYKLVLVRLDASLQKTRLPVLFFLFSCSAVAVWYPVFFMTTDAPAVFFWILSFYIAHHYFSSEENTFKRLLLLVVLSSSIGLGIWAKYTTFILLGSILLALFFGRGTTKRKCYEIFIVCFICGLFLVPIIWWNISHGWVNFAHNISHASKGVFSTGANANNINLNLVFLGDFLGAQLGLFGLFLPVMFYALFKKKYHNDKFELFLLISILSLFGLCLLVSLTKRVYPNWTIPVYYPLLLLTLPSIRSFFLSYPRMARFMVSVNFLVTFLAITLLLGVTWGLPGKVLPTKKLVGWNELIDEIQQRRVASENDKRELPVMTESYGLASQFAFLTHERDSIYCIPAGDRRMNQFDIWNENRGLSHLKGQDILLVLSPGVDISELRPWFEAIEGSGSFYYEYNSSKLREVSFFIGRNFTGNQFPRPGKF